MPSWVAALAAAGAIAAGQCGQRRLSHGARLLVEQCLGVEECLLVGVFGLGN